MGRTTLAALIATGLLLPNLSEAQRSGGSTPGTQGAAPAPGGGSFGAAIRHDAPPPSRPSTPAAPTPLVPQAPPSALDTPVDVFRAGPRTYAPRFDRSGRRNRLYGYGAGYYIPDPFGYISQPDSSSPPLDRYMNKRGPGYPGLDPGDDLERLYGGEPLADVAQRTAPRAPATPKTFYVIPRCYAGDVRPTADQLPRGCDIANLREVPPVVTRSRSAK
jgi:hypothetical protein